MHLSGVNHMILYYGGFPPPYGGVTIKNKLLYEHLVRELPITKMDTLKAKKNPALLAYQTIRLVLHRKGKYIVATSAASRKRITMLLWRFNRKAMANSIVMVMGGSVAEDVGSDPAFLKAMGAYKQLYVETASMKEKLEAQGLSNVSVYPNCRTDSRVDGIRPTGDRLRCLFFSRISPEKGADVVLQAARLTPDIQYDFYGQADADYEESFLAEVDTLSNVSYHGVFASDGSNIYSLMHSYDFLLLPTCYADEGVPGVLVEAKIAALPAIVSNASYNAEIVKHGISGLVLTERTGQCLGGTLEELTEAPHRVNELKQGALESAQDYLIENHLAAITAQLT